MRKLLTMNDIETLKDYVSVDVYGRVFANRYLCAVLAEGTYLVSFHFCDITDPMKKDDRVVVWCGADELVCFTDSRRCRDLIEAIDKSAAPLAQLASFFQALMGNDVYELEKIENSITELEDRILTDKHMNAGRSDAIIFLRRELLKMKRYYEQLSFVLSELADNESDTLPPELQKHFAVVDRRADYLLNFVLHLREYTTQVREAYQAQIDIEQNQIMKFFTVITTVFLPLTLIVGWYGMNFKMPEYEWEWGYIGVIAISVVIVIASIVIFKKKKWF